MADHVLKNLLVDSETILLKLLYRLTLKHDKLTNDFVEGFLIGFQIRDHSANLAHSIVLIDLILVVNLKLFDFVLCNFYLSKDLELLKVFLCNKGTAVLRFNSQCLLLQYVKNLHFSLGRGWLRCNRLWPLSLNPEILGKKLLHLPSQAKLF